LFAGERETLTAADVVAYILGTAAAEAAAPRP